MSTTATSKDIVLQVTGVSKRFGGLQALSEVGITIARGRAGHPDRLQRCGQNHHYEGHYRHLALGRRRHRIPG